MGIRITAHMVSSDEAMHDARQSHATGHEVSDGTARTIAGWWASPGTVGRTLAALSTGVDVDVEDLLDDIHFTRQEAGQSIAPDDSVALDMLATWALNHLDRD